MRIQALADVAEVNPRADRRLLSRPDLQVSFVPMAAVSETGTLVGSEERRAGDVMKGYTAFQRGDVLVAKITPCMENGKAALVDKLPHEFGFGSTEFHVLRPGQEVEPRYLFYMVWSPKFRSAAERQMTGSGGQKRVPTDFFERFEIPLPPLPEQRRIAAILDEADALRRKRREALALLDELLRATFLEMFGDPVTNPRGWPTVEMASLITDSQYGTAEKANTAGVGLPVLRMNNLGVDGRWELSDIKHVAISEADQEKLTVRPGDLLFNRTNSPDLVGKTGVWRDAECFAYAGYLIRIRFDQARVLPDYVSGYLNSAAGKRYLFERAKPSNNMSNFSASMFAEIPLNLPPVEAQQRFANLAAAIECERGTHKAGLEAAERLFGALLQGALSGDSDVVTEGA